jgi:hypothetical protein
MTRKEAVKITEANHHNILDLLHALGLIKYDEEPSAYDVIFNNVDGNSGRAMRIYNALKEKGHLTGESRGPRARQPASRTARERR